MPGVLRRVLKTAKLEEVIEITNCQKKEHKLIDFMNDQNNAFDQ